MTTPQRWTVGITIIVTLALGGVFAVVGLVKGNALAGIVSAVVAVLGLGLSIFIAGRPAGCSTVVVRRTGKVVQTGDGRAVANTGFTGGEGGRRRANVDLRNTGSVQQSGSDTHANTGIG
ncbi:MAG: hypothetical protein JXA67_11165 [Micromonosporaceae bacterium]|nr:hypothetical protein [Micromonosporaceae bacterium]